LGQQVIVENRGGGVIPGEVVSKAAPDGYTLLLYGATIWTGPLLQKTPYEPASFAPITLVARAPNLLVVTPALPVKSVKELIALAKARPGELNYSSSAIGTTSHLAGELFKSMAGVNIARIGYKEGGSEMADLVSGQVQMSFGTPGAVGALVKSGKLRALAVTSPQPSLLFPGLPTVALSGLPGFEAGTTYGVWAPARTSETIINRLHQEIVRFISTAEGKERLLSAGTEPVGSSPEQFAAAINSEVARLRKVIKEAGIRAE
jgi:tripartite-type tricarboxylate transporter receptor subunit TctC